MAAVLMTMTQCKKDDDNNEPGGGGTQTVATVTTGEVTEITETNAVCGGEVSDDGGATVTARGVCWSTEPNPTPSDNCTVNGEGVGAFTSEMTGLEPGTKYYVRAYAKNAAGTGFGAERIFTTLENGGGGGGRFSVSSTTTVEFAPGNLYWDGGAFRFEANQWSFADTWNENHVSHFKWSAAASAVTSGYSYSGDLFCANNFTVAGDSHTWRTLSKNEWSYLLNTSGGSSGRTDANRFAKARVNGVRGLLIFPDGYTLPEGYTTTDGGTGMAKVNKTSSSDAPWPSESIPTGTWASMESAGAVFLPAAGFRFGTDVHGVGSYGFFWSSSPGGSDYAYGMSFDSGGVGTNRDGRKYGNAVRLVR